MKEGKRRASEAGQLFGLGLSFGITMLVNIGIAGYAGYWIDGKFGFHNHPACMIGVLCGIFAGFHLFIEQIDQLEHPLDPEERGKDWGN